MAGLAAGFAAGYGAGWENQMNFSETYAKKNNDQWQIESQASNQIDDPVYCQVIHQIWGQVSDQAYTEISGLVLLQIRRSK